MRSPARWLLAAVCLSSYSQEIVYRFPESLGRAGVRAYADAEKLRACGDVARFVIGIENQSGRKIASSILRVYWRSQGKEAVTSSEEIYRAVNGDVNFVPGNIVFQGPTRAVRAYVEGGGGGCPEALGRWAVPKGKVDSIKVVLDSLSFEDGETLGEDGFGIVERSHERVRGHERVLAVLRDAKRSEAERIQALERLVESEREAMELAHVGRAALEKYRQTGSLVEAVGLVERSLGYRKKEVLFRGE